MAKDQEKVNLEPKIDEEIPSPQISGDQAGQSSSQASDKAVDFSALLASPEFEEFVEKKVQSKQDARLGKYGTRLDSLEDAISQYDELVESGMSKSEAVKSMRDTQELADIRKQLTALQGSDTSVASAGADKHSWAKEQATILEDAGLPEDDPRTVELMRSKTFESYDDYLTELRDNTFDWKQSDAKKPIPDSSAIAQTVQRVITQPGELDEYSDDQLADKLIDLARNPTLNQEEMDILDSELERRDKIKE
jgi:hypothetical protein